MATQLHVTTKRIQTLAGSDGSVIPVGTVTAVSAQPSVCSASVNASNNEVTITGIAPGNAGITYSAPGYVTTVGMVNVAPLPTLVITDGPEFS